MRAGDVMTRNVATISPTTPVRVIAQFLLDHGISAAPVVGPDHQLLGVVSEGDLIRRDELGTIPRRAWWLAWFSNPDAEARDFVKTRGLVATDVMTRGVIAVHRDAPLGDIAELMHKKNIKRVFVTNQGALTGVVTRADIVRALARQVEPLAKSRDDLEIRDEIERRMRAQPWAPIALVTVTVRNGHVELLGMVESQAQRQAVDLVARSVSGVQDVADYLVIRPALPSTV